MTLNTKPAVQGPISDEEEVLPELQPEVMTEAVQGDEEGDETGPLSDDPSSEVMDVDKAAKKMGLPYEDGKEIGIDPALKEEGQG